MQKTQKVLLVPFGLALIFFGACAHHRDVRPGTGGVNRVVVREQDKESAEQSAIRQAEHYCEQFQRHPAFLDEGKTSYNGSMDENTRDTVRKASKAARVLGGAGMVFGENGVRTGGTAVGAAGTVGGIMTSGNDYTAEMRFKCE